MHCTPTPSAPHRRQHGFTLIEVMIVLVIIAILSAIAYPSYQSYLVRAHRANARAALLEAAQYMERAATAQGLYPTTLPAALQVPKDSNRYTIAVQTAREQDAFTLTATLRSNFADPACGNLSVTHTGVRRASAQGADIATCWRK